MSEIGLRIHKQLTGVAGKIGMSRTHAKHDDARAMRALCASNWALTLRVRNSTLEHMKVVMDSDCLVKLTKAGLKERVCAAWDIHIPTLVRRETTAEVERFPDAVQIRENIDAGLITVAGDRRKRKKGEDAALDLFRSGEFKAIATDDTRFIRRLRGLDVPYAVPAVILVQLHNEGVLTRDQANGALEALSPLISPEEQAVAELMLTKGGES